MNKEEARWLAQCALKIRRQLGVEFDDARQTLAFFRAKGQVHQYAFLNAYNQMKEQVKSQPSHSTISKAISEHRSPDIEVAKIYPLLTENERFVVEASIRGLTISQMAQELGSSEAFVRKNKQRVIEKVLHFGVDAVFERHSGCVACDDEFEEDKE